MWARTSWLAAIPGSGMAFSTLITARSTALARSSAARACTWFGRTVCGVSKKHILVTCPRRRTKRVWAESASMAVFAAAFRVGSSSQPLLVSHGRCGRWSSMQSQPSQQKPGGSAQPNPLGYSSGFLGQPVRTPPKVFSMSPGTKSWPRAARKRSRSRGTPSRRKRAFLTTSGAFWASGGGRFAEAGVASGSARRLGAACARAFSSTILCSLSRRFLIQARLAATRNGSKCAGMHSSGSHVAPTVAALPFSTRE
mmetsp:Transcript_57439/g.170937  ORF Transcript_57439/g.170937 Transcript_57439/m.170937 type:complete len:254 (-) Transcript_57439:195-956(-)